MSSVRHSTHGGSKAGRGDSKVIPTGTSVGHCVLEKKVGRGGMGTVYLARHSTLNKHVAVKILRGDLPTDVHGVERFLREARAAARLEHPNIVPVYDAGRDGSTYYIVMQYVKGESLAARLAREGPLDLPEALRVFHAVAKGISHAHAHGIVHRDVKPDNVLLGEDGDVKIVDFGLARIIEGDPNLSRTGTILGSPNFMSPEQALGKKVDQRTDVYSLGATLYQMVVGSPPFKADSTLGVVYKVVREPLSPPRAVNPSVPLQLSQYICLLMRKDCKKRLGSVDKSLILLDKLYPAGSVSASSSRRSRLSKIVTTLAALVILTLGLVLSPWPASWVSSQQTTAESHQENSGGGSHPAVEAKPATDDSETPESSETPDAEDLGPSANARPLNPQTPAMRGGRASPTRPPRAGNLLRRARLRRLAAEGGG